MLQVFGPHLLVLTDTKSRLKSQVESRSRGVLNAARARSALLRPAESRVALIVPQASTKTLRGPMHVSSALSIRIGREYRSKDVVVRLDYMGLMSMEC